MSEISFTVSGHDQDLIMKIVDRAERILTENGIEHKRITLVMDLTATHANGCPLRLADMLGADVCNLLHDILGIATHIDRRTGKLGDCFVPRFAASQGVG
jgi:hypothetical protein